MRKLLLLGVALCALMAKPVQAADMWQGSSPSVPTYAPQSAYNWTGFYVGAHTGYGWGDLTKSSLAPSGWLGGIQGGVNFQIGQFVIGGETDLAVTGIDDRFANTVWEADYYGTLRARAGIAFNNILAYATAGLAYGRAEYTNAAGISDKSTHTGWAAGLGVEVGLTQNWNVRAEYMYTDLLPESYFGNVAKNGYESSAVRLGVNYKF